MNIKRFFGKNSKEALTMVRKALGDNAVILSNRTMHGGNEIMAFREEDIDALIQESSPEARIQQQESDFYHAAQTDEPSDFAQNMAYLQKADLTANDAFNRDASDHASSYNDASFDHQDHDPNFVMHADMAKFAKQIPPQRMVKPDFSPVKKPFANEAPQQKTVVIQAQRPAEPKNTSEMAAMLKEMRDMRNDIESQLGEIKKAELVAMQTMQRAALQKQQATASKPVVQKPQESLHKNMVKPAAKPVAKIAEQAPPQSPQMLAMLKEMRDMRSVFESKLTSLTWSNIQRQHPLKSNVLSMLLAAGFSASLSRRLAEKLPEHFNGRKMDGEQAKTWIKKILALNLLTIENEAELFDQGGIFALIGPTGVGKTTTTAKLAARYVMQHGTQNLGIITTDAYRIGGHEQLRIYGKILGVMVYAVKDEADLKIALNELKNKHTILIDTVGVSQRDSMVAEQIAMLSNTQRPIKKLLCMNATSTGETLTDVIRAYQGKGLDGCIMTKIDEAATIGNALDVMIRNKLKLFYATNGQRVPEDILTANKQALIEQAFKRSAATQWPYQFLDEELPFIMGNSMKKTPTNVGELGYV